MVSWSVEPGGSEMVSSLPGQGHVRVRDDHYVLDMDPRVEEEMEKLNKAIADVNNLDGDLFEAKQSLHKFVSESRRKLDKVYRAHRKAIERSRPYFKFKVELRSLGQRLAIADDDCLGCLLDFEDAKDNEAMAERALQASAGMHFIGSSGMDVLDNWNKATRKVLEYSKKKTAADQQRQQVRSEVARLKLKLDELHLSLGTSVEKAWQYYALYESLEKQLQAKLEVVREAGSQLAAAKEAYKEAFSSLDLVAAEIEQRQKLRDIKNGLHISDNLSQFEEIDDIECALESRFENLSLSRSECSLDDLDTSPRDAHSTGSDPATEPGSLNKAMSLAELSSHVWDLDSKKNSLTPQQNHLPIHYLDVSFQMDL